jgi:hypothetical protein
MKPGSWKDRLGAAGEDLVRRRGPLRVLVDLRAAEADEACLEGLRNHGLAVEEVVGNKVIGTVAGERLEELRGAPGVAEVEVPARLRPHRAPDRSG